MLNILCPESLDIFSVIAFCLFVLYTCILYWESQTYLDEQVDHSKKLAYGPLPWQNLYQQGKQRLTVFRSSCVSSRYLVPPRLCCSAHCKQCCPEACGASHQQALCRTMKPYLYVSPLHSPVVLSVSHKTEIYSCIGVSVKDHVVLPSNIMSKASCFAFVPKVCYLFIRGPWKAYYVFLYLSFPICKMGYKCVDTCRSLNTISDS